MSIRYAPLPARLPDHRVRHDIDSEMHAAFDYSDDEDEDPSQSESTPLHPAPTSPLSPHHSAPHTALPGTYDFENFDYDYPPPGSPPRPTAFALPNEHGNTNGLIPSFDSTRPSSQSWLQRAASRVLPSALLDRLPLRPSKPTGAVGGGIHNDGVFANVTAKPSAPVRIREGDETYVVSEDSRDDAPPSYATAQADAVPPYWDTTVHAPFAPDSMGEMIIDSLPTGSLFSFLWNMLVSVSFQFVGFLLTYLLHTTHAARLGSRAGLGVTLIQYGFALRSRLDGADGEPASWGNWKLHHPTPSSSVGDDPYNTSYNASLALAPGPGTATNQTGSMLSDATTEWLSFFLMTIGWFVLLTSLLGFWRVKRWERGILASQRETPGSAIDAQRDVTVVSQLFGSRGMTWSGLFSQVGRSTDRNDESASRAEEGLVHRDDDPRETDSMLPSDVADPQTNERIMAEMIARDTRLRADLRAAGFM
ncbi:hypothetical protein APHAL10511_001955 [Amanita phalloides]|nr:hypothetical protein APHAL10511_001955 [Amanita phalloides]